MTILFGGGEIGAFIPSDSNAYEQTSVPYDSSFARCAITAQGNSTYNESTNWGSKTDLWVHIEANPGAIVGSANIVVMVNTSGTEVLRLVDSPIDSSTTSWQMQWNNASVWTNIGSSVTLTRGVLQTADLHFYVNASGTANLYLAGTSRASGTANLSSLTDMVKLRCYGRSSGQGSHVSQIVVADESTIGWRLKTAPATGAGATTDWTGGYTEIDEIVNSDVDFVNSATNGQVELFSHSTTVPDGYRVKAVIVTARAKRGSSGPANLQLAIRSGSTTYTSASKALDVGYGAFVEVWETDPATSAAFTSSAISTLQFGVKAVT